MRRPPPSTSTATLKTAAPGNARRVVQAVGLTGLLLIAACHSSAWNDAWARCDASAIEQGEFAEVDSDQRTTWRERYIGACMQAKGFSDPQYLIK